MFKRLLELLKPKQLRQPALQQCSVSGSHSFKEQLINDFIPSIKEMQEKERKHLRWLINNDAPMDFIELSQKYYNHFTQRIREYQEYADGL